MSGDLEEFLRRAAERRQQRSGGQGSGRPATSASTGASGQRSAAGPTGSSSSGRRSAPQYTDRDRERRVQSRPETQIPVMAEILDDDEPLMAEAIVDESSWRTKKETARSASKKRKQAAKPTIDVVALLRSPSGLRQVFLAKEILEPRSKFWD